MNDPVFKETYRAANGDILVTEVDFYGDSESHRANAIERISYKAKNFFRAGFDTVRLTFTPEEPIEQ